MTKAKTPAARAATKPGKPVGTGPAPGVTKDQGIPEAGRIGKNQITSRPVSPGNTGSDPQPAALMFKGGKRVEARPRVQEPEGEARDLGALIRVQATRVGFVDNARRREGDVFDVHEAEFSDRWMQRVEDTTRERTTGPKEALAKIHDEKLAAKFGPGATADNPLNA